MTAKHRTNPIPSSISHINGYPKKLTLYKNEASSYWQVRYYVDGKIIRRSTKTENKTDAIKFAKEFYDEIIIRRKLGVAVSNKSSFAQCAEGMLKGMSAQVARDDITQATYKMAEYRLNASILPEFADKDVNDIGYPELEQYVTKLSKQKNPKLKATTIDGYLKVVRKVFNYAYRMRLLQMQPHFPVVKGKSGVRGYFTLEEYRKLWSRARSLVGKRFHFRKFEKKRGGSESLYVEAGSTSEGRLIRTTLITPELKEMIIFMVNSFVRPTDLKQLKNKHIEVVEKQERIYLRMRLPESKRHNDPIVTMPSAVTVYKRLVQHNKEQGWGADSDDYLFFPNYENRDHALKQLQRQFDVLMWNLDLGKGPKGEDRTIYSLRHSCIMFRLMQGEKMDLVTLARNARTSVDMIDKHYASQLRGEDNIDMLQSRRKRK